MRIQGEPSATEGLPAGVPVDDKKPKRKPFTTPTQLLVIGGFAFFTVCVAACVGFVLTHQEETVVVSADQLYAEYTANPQATINKYKTKKLMVSGIVGHYNDEATPPRFSLKVNGNKLAISCVIREDDEADGL